MATVDLLIPDIYRLLEDKKAHKKVDVETVLEEFGESCKEALRTAIGEERNDSGSLRLSGIGKPGRKLWNAFWGIRGEATSGPTYIKFLYGHLIEAMLLALAELSGHEVTEKQKKVEVEGIPGHQDCRIDGLLVDVKSASAFGFRKFSNNKLHEDDSFGYIPQLKAYAEAEGDTEYGWLAANKETGELALLKYDEMDTNAPYFSAVNWSVPERLREIKKLLEGPLPSLCYDDIPDGKSGNRKLQTGCVYCQYKSTCWPNAYPYRYSTGAKWLTHVAKEPRVPKEF